MALAPVWRLFDKAQLYSGAPLTLNQNWFEFVDPYSEVNNPVSTYTATINNREYLTASAIVGSQATVVYSYLEGATDAPAYFAGTQTVATSFPAMGGFLPAVDAPGCTACMQAWTNGWIHSSGVWLFGDGTPYVLSTMVLGDPRYTHATQIISVATNTQTGVATALQLAGGRDGAGPMAAEIAMPLRTSGGDSR